MTFEMVVVGMTESSNPGLVKAIVKTHEKPAAGEFIAYLGKEYRVLEFVHTAAVPDVGAFEVPIVRVELVERKQA